PTKLAAASTATVTTRHRRRQSGSHSYRARARSNRIRGTSGCTHSARSRSCPRGQWHSPICSLSSINASSFRCGIALSRRGRIRAAPFDPGGGSGVGATTDAV
ncbi:unnamed protein product, partial [Ectocarpus fasciculatus]